MVKYSFLIPVYNVENYLARCIESLLSQKNNKEAYEIILVDDGSTDSSGKICDEYAQKHSHIRCIHQDNQGLLMARGTGVRESKGEYLLFVDSDDFVEDDLLYTINKYIDKYNPDFLCYGFIKDHQDSRCCKPFTEKEAELFNQQDFIKLFASSDKYNSIWSKVVCGDIFRNHIDEIYSIRTNIGEDKLQTAYLAKYSNSIVFIGNCLYHYVDREDSIVHKKSETDIYNIIHVYQKVEKILEEIVTSLDVSDREGKKMISANKAVSLNGTLDHIYKYNKRNDLPKNEKATVLSRIVDNTREFWITEKSEFRMLKNYNKLRYLMLENKHYLQLIFIDEVISFLQRRISTNC